ncbi:PIN domain-containing protein (plasmid) [Synechocystis sp. B12]|nr:PIN domain-containing protein [Synechocystis sp. B12]
MKYILDTNILLRLRQPQHEHHQACLTAVTTLKADNHELCIISQNLYEYWVVATRPLENNGLGFTVSQAQKDLGQLKSLYSLYPDHPDTFAEWENLINHYQIKGKRAHDVRIIAAMLAHEIPIIVTINIQDFEKFTEIQAISPNSIK